MLQKYEKYFYIVSPILVLVSLFNFYLTRDFNLLSIITVVAGLLIGLLFFLRFYDDIVKKVSRRKIRYGVNSVIITVVVLAIVVIVYLVLMDRNKRFDLTAVKRFTLSDQTSKVIERLEGPVTVYAFYSKQQDASGITALFPKRIRFWLDGQRLPIFPVIHCVWLAGGDEHYCFV